MINSKSRRTILVIVLSIIFILAAAGGYWYWKNRIEVNNGQRKISQLTVDEKAFSDKIIHGTINEIKDDQVLIKINSMDLSGEINERIEDIKINDKTVFYAVFTGKVGSSKEINKKDIIIGSVATVYLSNNDPNNLFSDKIEVNMDLKSQ